jgi:hypothetical protein
VVKVTANYKAQNIKFWANEGGVSPGTSGAVPLDCYFVTDQWGNEYIMHASGQLDQSQVAAAFEAAVPRPGWTKSTRQKELVCSLQYPHAEAVGRVRPKGQWCCVPIYEVGPGSPWRHQW